MLVSKPKKRDLRGGARNIYFLPELSIMTGLTEYMRSDFIMIILSNNRVDPVQWQCCQAACKCQDGHPKSGRKIDINFDEL